MSAYDKSEEELNSRVTEMKALLNNKATRKLLEVFRDYTAIKNPSIVYEGADVLTHVVLQKVARAERDAGAPYYDNKDLNRAVIAAADSILKKERKRSGPSA